MQSWEDVKEREKRAQFEQLIEQFNLEEQMKDPNQKYIWNNNIERIFQSHKAEIRLGLTKVSLIFIIYIVCHDWSMEQSCIRTNGLTKTRCA